MTMSDVTSGLVGALLYLVAVVLWLRVRPATSPTVTVVLAVLPVYLCVLVGAGMVLQPVRFWPMTAAYALGALVFLLFFGALYKSVSLRIMMDLLKQPGAAAPYASIEERYMQTESFEARVTLLRAEGFMTGRDTALQLTEKGARLGWFVDRLQRMFAIETSG
jgi:hypothetical protein